VSALQGYGIAVIFDVVYNRFESSDPEISKVASGGAKLAFDFWTLSQGRDD
jgi:hypothetical protein